MPLSSASLLRSMCLRFTPLPSDWHPQGLRLNLQPHGEGKKGCFLAPRAGARGVWGLTVLHQTFNQFSYFQSWCLLRPSAAHGISKSPGSLGLCGVSTGPLCVPLPRCLCVSLAPCLSVSALLCAYLCLSFPCLSLLSVSLPLSQLLSQARPGPIWFSLTLCWLHTSWNI